MNEHPNLAAYTLLNRAAKTRTPPHSGPTPRSFRCQPPGQATTCQSWAIWATRAKPAPSPWRSSTVAFKKPQGGELTEDQKAHNTAHNGKRAVGERGNSLLKTTFKALRTVSLCPWAIGKIVAAALVLLHIDHDRTT
jgi:hypothetical protein